MTIKNQLNFSRYLTFTLLIFSLSFFVIETPKLRNNLFYGLFAVPTLLISIKNSWSNFKTPPREIMFLIVFFIFSLIAEYLSGDSIVRLLRHQSYIILLLLGLKICLIDKLFFNKAALLYGVTTFILSCWSLQIWLNSLMSFDIIARVELYAAASNPVHASLLLLTGWVGFWLLFALPKLEVKNRSLYIFGFFTMVSYALQLCIIFQSRSALVGLLAVTGAWTIYKNEYFLALIVVIIELLAFYYLGGYEILSVRAGSYRVEIWSDALQRLNDSSWLFGSSQESLPPYLGKFHHAHSAYISILTNTGLIGAFSFIAFATTYFKKGVKTGSTWFIISLLGWAGVIATSSGLVDSPRPLWIYFWIPTLLTLLETKQQEILPETIQEH